MCISFYSKNRIVLFIETKKCTLPFSLSEMLHCTDCECIRDVQVLHGQIDIVRQKLSEITRKDVKRDVNASIKMLIIHHQRITSFAKNIEAFFSNVALIQFVSNTMVICCTGFLIVIVSTHVR